MTDPGINPQVDAVKSSILAGIIGSVGLVVLLLVGAALECILSDSQGQWLAKQKWMAGFASGVVLVSTFCVVRGVYAVATAPWSITTAALRKIFRRPVDRHK
ncbi:MAG: hypothetical protein ABFC96_15705 [Thermoguttaceae bacterium]